MVKQIDRRFFYQDKSHMSVQRQNLTAHITCVTNCHVCFMLCCCVFRRTLSTTANDFLFPRCHSLFFFQLQNRFMTKTSLMHHGRPLMCFISSIRLNDKADHLTKRVLIFLFPLSILSPDLFSGRQMLFCFYY